VTIRQRNWLYIGAAVLVTWFAWPGSNELNGSCEPESLFSRLRADLFGQYFWERQREDIQSRASSAENWDSDIAAANASNDAELENSKRLLEEFYARFPDMAPSPAARRAQELRDTADKIEKQEFARTISA
jgi:hypothetical protein